MARGRRHISGKYTGLVIILLTLLTVSSLFSEDFSGRIILEKTSFIVGEEFSLSILVPGAAPLMLSVETPKIPAGIRLLKGPYMRPGKSGTVVDYYFRVEKQGRYLLGSFTLKTAIKTGYTPPVFIKAGKSNFQLSGIDDIPPSVKWAFPVKTYYPGEIIPLMFVVENLESDDISLESSIYNNNSGIVNRISKNGNKEEKTILTKNIMTGSIYDIIFHDHIFIPVIPGNISLPGAEVFLSRDEKSYSTFLPEKKIVITPVPSKISSSAAIGSFTADYSVSDTILHDDGILIIKTVLEGTGNFYAVTIPTPYTDKPGIIEIAKIKENISVVPDGRWFTGSLTVRFSMKLAESVKDDFTDTVQLTIPDMTVMKIGEEHGEQRGYEFYTLPGSSEKVTITSERDVFTYPNLYTENETGADLIVISLAAAVLILASFAAIFGVKNKHKYISAAALILIALILIFLFIYIFKENEEYGIILSNSQSPDIYTVPEKNSSIKYSGSRISEGLRVPVKGSYQDYLLIEMPDGGEGWIKKDNIRLEDE